MVYQNNPETVERINRLMLERYGRILIATPSQPPPPKPVTFTLDYDVKDPHCFPTRFTGYNRPAPYFIPEYISCLDELLLDVFPATDQCFVRADIFIMDEFRTCFTFKYATLLYCNIYVEHDVFRVHWRDTIHRFDKMFYFKGSVSFNIDGTYVYQDTSAWDW